MIPLFSSNTFLVGCSGLGTRTITDFKATVITALANADFFASSYSRGHFPRLNFLVFEREKEGSTGFGFRVGVDATTNTGVPGPLAIEGIEQIPKRYRHVVRTGTDLASCVSDYVSENHEAILTDLKRRNPCAAAMLMNSFKDGKLNTSRPCMTRGIIAEVDMKCFRQIQKFARFELNTALGIPEGEAPLIDLEILYDTKVLGLSLRNPQRPSYLIERNGHRMYQPVDFASISNGPTWKYPELDRQVSEKTYYGDSNYDRFGDFFKEHKMLDQSSHFKEGISVGFMGTKLTSFDRKSVCHAFGKMANIQRVAGMHRVILNKEECKNRQGIYQTLSRGESNPPAPKHGYDLSWPGKNRILTSRHVQAVFSSGTEDSLSLLLDVAVGIVGMQTKVLPKDIVRDRTIKELACFQLVHNEKYLCASRGEATILQYMRIALHRILYGKGLENDRFDKIFTVAASHTRQDRDGFPIDNAWGNHNGAKHDFGGSNMPFDKSWDLIMQYVTSSPHEIHDAMAQGFKNGIDEHSHTRVQDIRKTSDGRLRVGNKSFDVLMAAPILTSEGDPVLRSLRGQVRENNPGQPRYSKWRLLQARDGRLCHAWDYGLGGEGVRKTNADGQVVTSGQQWADTTSHHGAADVAPFKAKTLLMLSSLAATGHTTPMEYLNQCYQDQLPTRTQHNDEMRSLARDWADFFQKHAFVELCKAVARNGAEFSRLMERIVSPEMQRSVAAELAEDSRVWVREEVSIYHSKTANIPEFRPASRDAFDERFLSPLPRQMSRMWNRIATEVSHSLSDSMENNEPELMAAAAF